MPSPQDHPISIAERPKSFHRWNRIVSRLFLRSRPAAVAAHRVAVFHVVVLRVGIQRAAEVVAAVLAVDRGLRAAYRITMAQAVVVPVSRRIVEAAASRTSRLATRFLDSELQRRRWHPAFRPYRCCPPYFSQYRNTLSSAMLQTRTMYLLAT